jgi:hypothetical protein
LAFILLLALLPLACARLPEIREAEPATAQRTAADCAAIFPRGAWQFVHAIQFFPPDGSSQTLVGVVRLSSEAKRFHCVMLTIEGLVLFEAEYDGTITIKRAIAPLDKPGVAEGMVEDIRLIFFAPGQPSLAAGLFQEQSRGCRYLLADDGHEDILLAAGGTWQIQRYSPGHRLVRSVAPLSQADIRPDGMAARLELKAPGLAGYRLVMRLMEAVPIEKAGAP